MRNKGIRIIKLCNPVAKSVTAVETVKTDEEIRLDHGNIVKDWIAERRENSRLERIFTDNRIVAWKSLPNV